VAFRMLCESKPLASEAKSVAYKAGYATTFRLVKGYQEKACPTDPISESHSPIRHDATRPFLLDALSRAILRPGSLLSPRILVQSRSTCISDLADLASMAQFLCSRRVCIACLASFGSRWLVRVSEELTGIIRVEAEIAEPPRASIRVSLSASGLVLPPYCGPRFPLIRLDRDCILCYQ
jgi:hypothetical protein